MNKIKSYQQQSVLRFFKICFSCFGIVGTTILTSGVLKMGVLNNDRKLDYAFRFVRPVSDGLRQIVEHALY